MSLPARLAVLPFRCGPTPCEEMNQLQAGLVDQLVEDSTFELVMTQETEELFLEPPRFRSAFDRLAAAAATGQAPDSATGALLARRLRVDGFLYAFRTLSGPTLAVWTFKPQAAVVFRYAAASRPSEDAPFLPEARHESAATKGAEPATGGSSGGSSSSGGSGGGGGVSGSSSKYSSSTPQVQMKAEVLQNPALIAIPGHLDDHMRETVRTVAEALVKARYPDGRPAKK